jgi:hypothetical protein
VGPTFLAFFAIQIAILELITGTSRRLKEKYPAH